MDQLEVGQRWVTNPANEEPGTTQKARLTIMRELPTRFTLEGHQDDGSPMWEVGLEPLDSYPLPYESFWMPEARIYRYFVPEAA